VHRGTTPPQASAGANDDPRRKPLILLRPVMRATVTPSAPVAQTTTAPPRLPLQMPAGCADAGEEDDPWATLSSEQVVSMIADETFDPGPRPKTFCPAAAGLPPPWVFKVRARHTMMSVNACPVLRRQ
jgi:hypothetical protein